MPDPWLPTAEHISCTKGGGSYDGSPYRFCFHTTEGDPGSVDGCRSMAQSHESPPQLWYHPGLDWFAQGLPLNKAAYALAHPSGTPNTNNAGAIQIELFGFAADTPGWPGDWVDRLGSRVLAAVLSAGWPIDPNNVAPTAGNEGYGTSGAVRFDDGTWAGFNGVCGHANVPSNDHWDPGALDLGRVVRAAGGAPAPGPGPSPAPGGPAPPFPYPGDHYLGQPDPDPRCHSGFYGDPDTANVRTWQAQMAARGWTIDADGQYGPQSQDVCSSFQEEKGLGVDGLAGPQTWAAAWTASVT